MLGPTQKVPSAVAGGVRYLVACIVGPASEEALTRYARACLTGVDFPRPSPAIFFDTDEIWVKTAGMRFHDTSVAHSPLWRHLFKFAGTELGHQVDEYEFNILLHWIETFTTEGNNKIAMDMPSTVQGAIAAAAEMEFAEAKVHEAKEAFEKRNPR